MIPNDLHHIGMREPLLRGIARTVRDGPEGAIVRETASGEDSLLFVTADSPAHAEALVRYAPPEGRVVLSHEDFTARAFAAARGLTVHPPDILVVYEKKEPLPLSGRFEIRPLTEDYAPRIAAVYEAISDPEYIRGRIAAGQCFGAFRDGQWAGFAGLHDDGTMGLLQIFPAFRRQGAAGDLVAYDVGYHLARGWTPYGHVHAGNEASLALQRKLGLTICGEPVYWCY